MKNIKYDKEYIQINQKFHKYMGNNLTYNFFKPLTDPIPNIEKKGIYYYSYNQYRGKDYYDKFNNLPIQYIDKYFNFYSFY